MNEYFSHDYNARNDINLKKLFMSEGLLGIGLYWCLVEMLYENNGYLNLDDIPTIAYDLRTKVEKVNNVIYKFDLFCTNEKQFFSNSIIKRLNIRNEKSEKARKSAEARWENIKENYNKNANVMRTHNERNASALRPRCERNAIKENNIKEKKKDIILDKNIISKQASNLKKEETNISCVNEYFQNEDYDVLLEEFGVDGIYKDAIFRFIKHLKVNFNLVMLNERLENLIVKLDRRCDNDIEKAKIIDDAIVKGYKRLECEE